MGCLTYDFYYVIIQLNLIKTLSREVEGRGPMKPGNQLFSKGANSRRLHLKDEELVREVSSLKELFLFSLFYLMRWNA